MTFPIDLAIKLLDDNFTVSDAPVIEFMSLQGNSPFKILIATILSARTNDKTTSKVVTFLFERIKDFADLDKIPVDELEKLLYPVGFYRQKAKQLKQLPQVIREEFKGKIPSEIDDLVKLPGVGRKTANLVRTAAFKLPAICVDIHVHRISNRWGYVSTKTPTETEFALREKLPLQHWDKVNYLLVALGQTICRPLRPKCEQCLLTAMCPKII